MVAAIRKVKSLFVAKVNYSHPTAVNQSPEVIVDEHYLQAISDLDRLRQARNARLKVIMKRRTYFKYFNIRQRYGISFKEFNRKVDDGVWNAYLAD